MKRCITCFVVILYCVLISAFQPESCEKCVVSENCPQFLLMSQQDQQRWLNQFPCLQEDQSFYGFIPAARTNYVCCPGTNVWSIVNEDPGRRTNFPYDQPDITRPTQKPNFNVFPPFDLPNVSPTRAPNFGITQPTPKPNVNVFPPFGIPNVTPTKSPNFSFTQKPNIGNQYPNYIPPGQPGYDQNFNNGFYPGNNNPPYFIPTVQPPNFNNQYPPCPNNNQFGYQNPNVAYNPNCNYQPGFNGNDFFNPYPTQTPYPNQIYPGWNTATTRPVYPPSNLGIHYGSQCPASSLPPEPETGCCGLDVSGAHGTTDLKNIVTQRIRNQVYVPNNLRLRRETENGTTGIELDDRIAGGTETQLNQFPWTALLKVTFDYGTNKTTFNCGGSVLSSRYILTAAHCIYDKGARISEMEIILAEYDKRTFPRDCKLNYRGERTCIDNILMYPESIVRHPEYDDKKLFADIALIRLRGNAPYTEFVRPICLPPVNVDHQAFYGLPLPVAGWGRNGPYTSDIKQSTVLNLVPHDECRRSYPNLSPSHLCAAGRTGEDTCKGDSGGPLMMLYGGQYYVIGIVSGKRADSPCGTTVPSLYTNVFQYIQWIRNNIN